MAEIDRLGDWRRTHFTKDVKSGPVTLMGWVHEVRLLGKVNFFLLRDREGIVQVTAKRGECPDSVFDKIKKLGREDVVGVKGVAKKSNIAKLGLEVFPKEIKILNKAAGQPPLDVRGKVQAELDTRLNARIVDLRRPSVNAIFRIRDGVFTAAREFLEKEGFIEIHTPKIIKAGAEGGATLFPIEYFGGKAYLSQSPQLYKEALTSSFDRVYEISPFFRAEPSDTSRHISEFTGIDFEMAFADESDVMDETEGLFYHIIKHVEKNHEENLETIERKLTVKKPPYKRITYDKALGMLANAGKKIEWGEDIDTEGEKMLGEKIRDPFFVTHYPTKCKPFYISPGIKNPKICRSFDFDYCKVELGSGGMRIHQKESLIRNIKDHGIDPKTLEEHTKTFDWGMPPHGGVGLGGDRIVMVIVGAENVREVVVHPRDRMRLVP